VYASQGVAASAASGSFIGLRLSGDIRRHLP
jgi:hypothetical protein